MTHPALIERITRSLAYMLRHQPEKFDVEVDAYGFADVDEVIRALNERLGESVVLEDVEAAVESGDRVRYEIQGNTIRALYGHSIPVEPGKSSKPPELLYLAIPSRDAERAQRFGLRGGRRRFVHLALSESDARDAGRRASREYTVLTIRALDAWEEGINFYDRRSLFLAEEVPTHLIEIGETYDDGEPPPPRGRRDDRRDRDSRRGGRGRGRRDERGGRGRDRDRERSRESEEVEIAAAPPSSSSNGRGGGEERGGRGRSRRRPERGDRGDRNDRGGRGDRGRGGRRDDRDDRRGDRGEGRAPAATPTREDKREAPVLTGKRSPEPSAAFGAGLFETPAPAPEKPREREAPPAPKAEPKPEPKPEPEEAKPDDGGFGAGL